MKWLHSSRIRHPRWPSGYSGDGPSGWSFASSQGPFWALLSGDPATLGGRPRPSGDGLGDGFSQPLSCPHLPTLTRMSAIGGAGISHASPARLPSVAWLRVPPACFYLNSYKKYLLP